MKDSVSFEEQCFTFRGETILRLNEFETFNVIAIGKAASKMLAEFLKMFPLELSRCLCIYPEQVDVTAFDEVRKKLSPETCRFIPSSHPLPTEKSFQAGKYLLNLVKQISNDKNLTFFLISGGTSALVEQPRIPPELYKKSVSVLYRAGLTIHQLNTIRIALSKVKGGQILPYMKGTIVALVISDVPGDDLSFVGSGITVPKKITKEELTGLLLSIPPSLREELPEELVDFFNTYQPPKSINERDNLHNLLIGSNYILLTQIERIMRKMGYNTHLLTSSLQGSVSNVATRIYTFITGIILNNQPIKAPACLLAGGETTVEIKGDCKGIGGRNQELCLELAIRLHESPEIKKSAHEITVLSVGTDGIDGNSNYAGAIISDDTITAENLLIAKEHLLNHDSTSFFETEGNCLIKTGPTGTNVMDIVLIVIKSNKNG